MLFRSLVQDQILQLLNELQIELGLSYLFITHDLAVVRQIADNVLVMQGGKVVAQAGANSIFATPQEEYTQSLLAAIPARDSPPASETRCMSHESAPSPSSCAAYGAGSACFLW